ncbi:response regulator [Variovorax sp. dw_954]|uniref:response regulator n=1 Tax=Variovorax sp. dw_954 TaxID=2720078 RepID=UPI002116783D|nr:response regulator [Variovorax sp. dw_954]
MGYSSHGSCPWRSCGRLKPHVVILDIGLPVLEGYEVARRIRLRPEGKNTLLIALTGYGQLSDRQAAVDAGFNKHFVKPADTTLMLARIDAWRARAGALGCGVGSWVRSALSPPKTHGLTPRDGRPEDRTPRAWAFASA